MPVEIRPTEFSMVFFDAAEIQGIVEKLVAEIGLPGDLDVTVEIDETTPMGRARVASIDPVLITAESGALEDVKAPRQLSEVGTLDVIGKLLFSVRDRRDPAFGEPPPDDDLTLQQSVAWEVYCVGRLGRLGHPVQRQRRLYQFRNRHGFTDAADAAFARLWEGDDLTWDDISRISQEALAALPG
jgi:hypothetical protein